MRSCIPILVVGVLLTPLSWSTARAITILDDGTAVIDSPVDCGAHRGRVVLRTGVHLQEQERDFRGAVSVAFQATQGNALSCCWVQFVWAEAIATVESGGVVVARGPVGGAIRTTGGLVTMTMDPTQPQWSVDSSGRSPCYESGGLSFKDQAGTRIFDLPINIGPLIAPAVQSSVAPASVTRIETTLHFEAYLVCDRQVCFKVAWEVQHSWAPPNAPGGAPILTGPTFPAPTGTAGRAIRPEQKAAAESEHPGQTILPP